MNRKHRFRALVALVAGSCLLVGSAMAWSASRQHAVKDAGNQIATGKRVAHIKRLKSVAPIALDAQSQKMLSDTAGITSQISLIGSLNGHSVLEIDSSKGTCIAFATVTDNVYSLGNVACPGVGNTVLTGRIPVFDQSIVASYSSGANVVKRLLGMAPSTSRVVVSSETDGSTIASTPVTSGMYYESLSASTADSREIDGQDAAGGVIWRVPTNR